MTTAAGARTTDWRWDEGADGRARSVSRCSLAAAAEGSKTVATVGGDEITAKQLEWLFAKVTQGEMSSSERNLEFATFLARLKEETKARYEPGYAPGS